MTHIPSFGGNGKGAQGQVQIIAAAQQIPFPSNVLVTSPPSYNSTYGVTFTGLEGRRRRVRALDDIYIGFTSAVTAATGFLIPAGEIYDITTRDNVWFIGATGTGVVSSSSLSLVPQIYSSSSISDVPNLYSSSSLSPVPTSGFSSSSSSASPYSSSSNVAVPTYSSSSSHVAVPVYTSSSSGVFVPTYGQLYWLEEFDT